VGLPTYMYIGHYTSPILCIGEFKDATIYRACNDLCGESHLYLVSRPSLYSLFSIWRILYLELFRIKCNSTRVIHKHLIQPSTCWEGGARTIPCAVYNNEDHSSERCVGYLPQNNQVEATLKLTHLYRQHTC
jgi:hypothetical protein